MCLDSIAAQTETPDEVIVVDNNSSDKTAAMAKSYPFVRLITEKRRGVVFARDKGFNSTTADLIGRIDADTVLPPGWVGYIRRFYATESNYTHALTGGCYFYNVRLPRFAGWLQGQIAFRMNRLLLGHYILFGANMVIPAKIWKIVSQKVCHEQDIHEDLDLAIHVHDQGYNITYHEGLHVGVKMRRVRSSRAALWKNMMMWPNTLRRHDKWSWPIGWLGAVVLYASFPVVIAAENLSRLLGRPPLEE